jgi:N-acyl-D-amino-acid deacylase
MDEIISLAKIASKYGARYISHIRSEDRYFWSAVEEIITIGKKADIPVQISHIKLAMGSLLGKTKKLLDRLDQARKDGIKISADIYPYIYWQSTMQVLFPERDFGNKTAADFALSEITTPDGVIISEYTPNPKYEGMVLNEVATMRGQDPSQTLMDMIAATLEKDQSESIIAKSMREEDIIVLLNWEHTNLCTDGGSTGGHPRGYGSYPKVLGQYVREKKYLTIEQAIHKMTAIPANNMGLKGRGKLASDMAADMVVFDPITVQDRATFNSPNLVSKGILHVLVSGKFVLKNKKITRNRPGIFLNRVKQRTEG